MSVTPSPAELEHIVYGDNCPPHGIPRPDIEALNRDDWDERLNPSRCFAKVAFLTAVFWAWLVRRVRS